MRERGLSSVGAAVLAGLLGLATATAMTDWMVVDVRTGGEDSMRIVVPFPLVAADIALGFVPEEALEDAEIPAEVGAQREAVLGAVRALADVPDAVLVRVSEPGAEVLVAKDGDTLVITVDEADTHVRCAIPIRAVRDALEDWDWRRVDPRMLLDVVHAAGPGTLVQVEDGDTRVAIHTW